MAKETVECFKCENCGAKIFVCWGEKETERDIPCSNCYGQVWEAPTYNELDKDTEAKLAELTAQRDALAKEIEEIEITRVSKPQTCSSVGWCGTLTRGKGVETLDRADAAVPEFKLY